MKLFNRTFAYTIEYMLDSIESAIEDIRKGKTGDCSG